MCVEARGQHPLSLPPVLEAQHQGNGHSKQGFREGKGVQLTPFYSERQQMQLGASEPLPRLTGSHVTAEGQQHAAWSLGITLGTPCHTQCPWQAGPVQEEEAAE